MTPSLHERPARADEAVYIGLGANLGDAFGTLRQALVEFDAIPGTRVRGRSALYRTRPVGYADQPEFVNAVVRLQTDRSPAALHAALKAIETRHGRTRSFANAPRTLDLDLLLFGDREFVTPDLIVPHPRMHLRAFVLAPLVDIDPAAAIPGKGAARTLLAGLTGQEITALPDPFD